LSAFERIRYRHHDTDVFLYAFDLIELDGNHLRRDPLAVRKATLASLLSRAAPGGFASTSISTRRMGRSCSRTRASSGLKASCRSDTTLPYRSGRSPDWIKS
jgi:ATP-dependent DNA ligase